MSERKSSLVLSFLIGSLIGGGMTFLLATHFLKTRSVRAHKTKWLRDETEEQPYEEGIYCAPEGADLHYDVGKDMYYSKD